MSAFPKLILAVTTIFLVENARTKIPDGGLRNVPLTFRYEAYIFLRGSKVISLYPKRPQNGPIYGKSLCVGAAA